MLLLVGVAIGAGACVAWYFRGETQADLRAGSADAMVEAKPPAASAQATPPAAGADASAGTTIQFAISTAPSAGDLNPDRNMVGLPFKPSDSIVSDCLLVSWRPCQELKVFLERLEAESRDEAWARDMEARIEKAVVSGERGKFRIRALECRRTRCALEVASEVDTIGLLSDADPEFDELMFPRASGIAREDDPLTGTRTIVSVQTWQTWKAFEAEAETEEDASE